MWSDPSTPTRLVFLGLAVLYWNLVLPVLEWRTGKTLGKRMFRLQVVSDDATAISLG